MDDINVIITDNTPAPNPTAVQADGNAVDTATDQITPRARTRSATAAQSVVKKTKRYHMDNVDLRDVDSIINNMCKTLHDGTYYFHQEIINLTRIKHKGAHELAVYCIANASGKKKDLHVGIAMAILLGDTNCNQATCDGLTTCKHLRHDQYGGIGY